MSKDIDYTTCDIVSILNADGKYNQAAYCGQCLTRS
jgi:hypothetical protein